MHTPRLNLVVLWICQKLSIKYGWHEGLIFKLKSVGISDILLELINSFLKKRLQKVVLNVQTSEWLPLKADVPQVSILDSLFSLIYINDLSSNIVSTVKLFAMIHL